MSKEEVKEEMKRMEGDPLVKQRRSRVARQLAMQRTAQAVPKADVVVTSGGVSVGEADYVKTAVERLGRVEMWKVAMKPGKPIVYGRVNEADFIGLPGNPVSSFVTFLLCVAPVLKALTGADPQMPASLPLRADFDWPKPDKRREFLRVRLNEQGGLDLFGNQSSGVLTSTVWADGLVDNPPGQVVKRGDTVRFLPLSELIAR